ncbi:MAG: S-layer homology domain-containing protein [Candidatus Peribacteraceae bacterium]
MFNRLSLRVASATLALALPLSVVAQTAFTDVPADSNLRPAVEYLASKGILQVAEKFNPDQNLTREQAAKVIIASIVSAEELAKVTATQFKDVSGWSVPFVEAARIMGVVQTVEKFRPVDPVTKAEFIKMTLAARGIDYNAAFNDITGQLSKDVPVDAWFASVMRYAIASSMTAVDTSGNLNPEQKITRAQMALLLFRLDMYAQNQRTQALLSQAETDIGNVLQQLEAEQPDEAGFASTRSILAARGALASRPDEVIVKAAVKISEAFSQLVAGYRAGAAGNFDETIAQAKAAYASADKAESFSPALSALANQIRDIAKNMAEEARTVKAQGGIPQPQ